MFDQLPGKSLSITIAKVAALLAITAGVSFGLCTVGLVAANVNGGRASRIMGPMAVFFGWLVATCLVGLGIVAVVAVVRAIIDSFSNKKIQ